MCLMLLGRGTSASAAMTRWLVRQLQAFTRELPFVFLRSRCATVVALSAGLVAGGRGRGARILGGEFMPDFRESNFVVFMAGKPDARWPNPYARARALARNLQADRGSRERRTANRTSGSVGRHLGAEHQRESGS